ncbi:hypothetical protein THMIRHAT_21540 [Thiosulfativibrio zosterae]|uniref:TonB-dependent receptor plug domain-containing protein n=1 Tax=Thiosulfativibrio zosterae TaxID=2675053 RepID=A0A6F8PQV3_9GAMM|nr:hypothetical protein THMIRHAT_21540 [Thiosulfativibrio zosterae]
MFASHHVKAFFKVSIVAGISFLAPVYADETTIETDILSPLPEDELVNSAWFSSTLTRKEIENSGAKSIPEVLRLLPGMMYVSPWGSYKTASYRGMTDEFPRRTLFEVDGVPINVAATGGVEWNAMPVRLEDIEKIVLVSTPSTVLNGDGAFNGVVKIFTVKPDQASNLVSVMGGTNAYRDVYARGTFRADDTLSFQLAASKQASDGDHVKVSDEDLNRVWGSVLYAPSYENQVTLNLGVGRANVDDSDRSEDVKASSYQDRSINNTQANVNWVNRSVGETTVVLGFNDLHNDAQNVIENGVLNFDIAYRSNRQFASVKHRQMFSGLEVSLGADYVHDDEVPLHWSGTESKWHSIESSGHLGLKYDAGSFSLSGGARLANHSEYKDNVLNQFAALEVKLPSQQKISMMYSEGSRFLTNWESRASLYGTLTPLGIQAIPGTDAQTKLFLYNSQPNDLKPERVASYALKYSIVRQKNQFSARLFHDSYSDLSYFDFETCDPSMICAYDNNRAITSGYGDKMVIKGGELFANWVVQKNHQVVLSYTRNFVEVDSGNLLLREQTSPEHILSAMLSSKIGKNKVNFIYHYFSQVRWEAAGNHEEDEKTLRGYANISVNLQRCFDVGDYDALCLQASAENLLEEDSTFYELEDSKTARNFYLKMDYRF